MTSHPPLIVAVVGATGALGEEVIGVLEERAFPTRQLVPLASSRSLGRTISFAGQEGPVQVLGTNSFAKVDLALFCVGAEISQEFIPKALKAGAQVIDASPLFQLDPAIPLRVAEFQYEPAAASSRLWANPSGAALLLALVLAPLHRHVPIRRAVVTVGLTASHGGRRGIDELATQSMRLLSGQVPAASRSWPRRLAFNCLPVVGGFDPDGASSREETRLIDQLSRLLDPRIKISTTCLLLPQFGAACATVALELAEFLQPEAARAILREAPGVVVMDDPAHEVFPTPLDAVGQDPCLVGRIRQDPFVPHGLHLWLTADPLRRCAINMVQTAEQLLTTDAQLVGLA